MHREFVPFLKDTFLKNGIKFDDYFDKDIKIVVAY